MPDAKLGLTKVARFLVVYSFQILLAGASIVLTTTLHIRGRYYRPECQPRIIPAANQRGVRLSDSPVAF